MLKNNKNIPDFLLRLTDGFSTYCKVSIKFWITIAIFSIIIIMPAETAESEISMPFNLGNIKKTDFYPIAFLIISLLIICFGSALSQATRTRKLIQRAINKLKNEYIFCENIYLQDIIDSLIYPSLSRVAPLAQILLGKDQFYPEANNVSRIKKSLSLFYYLVLKIISFLVMYIFPGYALIKSFFGSSLLKFNISLWGIPSFFFWIIGFFSFLILVQLFILDIAYTVGVCKRLTQKNMFSENVV